MDVNNELSLKNFKQRNITGRRSENLRSRNKTPSH